jgi:hypothetical protein
MRTDFAEIAGILCLGLATNVWIKRNAGAARHGSGFSRNIGGERTFRRAFRVSKKLLNCAIASMPPQVFHRV